MVDEEPSYRKRSARGRASDSTRRTRGSVPADPWSARRARSTMAAPTADRARTCAAATAAAAATAIAVTTATGAFIVHILRSSSNMGGKKADVGHFFQCGFARSRALLGSMFYEDRTTVCVHRHSFVPVRQLSALILPERLCESCFWCDARVGEWSTRRTRLKGGFEGRSRAQNTRLASSRGSTGMVRACVWAHTPSSAAPPSFHKAAL